VSFVSQNIERRANEIFGGGINTLGVRVPLRHR